MRASQGFPRRSGPPSTGRAATTPSGATPDSRSTRRNGTTCAALLLLPRDGPGPRRLRERPFVTADGRGHDWPRTGGGIPEDRPESRLWKNDNPAWYEGDPLLGDGLRSQHVRHPLPEPPLTVRAPLTIRARRGILYHCQHESPGTAGRRDAGAWIARRDPPAPDAPGAASSTPRPTRSWRTSPRPQGMAGPGRRHPAGRVGAGSMGPVYYGLHAGLRAEVAVRLLNPALSATTRTPGPPPRGHPECGRGRERPSRQDPRSPAGRPVRLRGRRVRPGRERRRQPPEDRERKAGRGWPRARPSRWRPRPRGGSWRRTRPG